MKTRPFLAVSAALLVAACLGTKTRTWQGEEFAALQPGWLYYRWEGPPLTAEGKYQDNLMTIDHALRQEVDAALAKGGYQRDGQRAQFELDYRIGDESSVGQAGQSYPMSPREEFERTLAGPNAEYEVSSRFYTHHTLGYHQVSHLKLTVYDIGSSRIVWESSASKLVDDPTASAEKVGERIGSTARKLIGGFPAAGQRRQ